MDLATAMRDVLDRVRADAAGTGVTVALRADPDLVDGGGAPLAGGVVVTVVHESGWREFAVDLAVGVEQACVAVVSAVQDAVVETWWRPWPEVPVGVLDVGLHPDGTAYWLRRDTPVCPVGRLPETWQADAARRSRRRRGGPAAITEGRSRPPRGR